MVPKTADKLSAVYDTDKMSVTHKMSLTPKKIHLHIQFLMTYLWNGNWCIHDQYSYPSVIHSWEMPCMNAIISRNNNFTVRDCTANKIQNPNCTFIYLQPELMNLDQANRLLSEKFTLTQPSNKISGEMVKHLINGNKYKNKKLQSKGCSIQAYPAIQQSVGWAISTYYFQHN